MAAMMAKASHLVLVVAVFCTQSASVPEQRAAAFVTRPLLVSQSRNHETWDTKRARGTVVPFVMMGATPSSSAHLPINKDVLVIGGGLAGLATALELAKRGRQVTVLSRDRGEAAAEAAGGMIAPQSERLESGPYLDLCLSSRAMYADWISDLERIAGFGGASACERDTTETHFWSSGGFLCPAFEGDAVHVWNPPPEGGQSHWLGRDQVDRGNSLR